MSRQYSNPWIPSEAAKRLESEEGSILDVGGGSSPYYRASHILDVGHYDVERLVDNAWGGERNAAAAWTREEYTQFDLCSGLRWPFDDNQFDLGLCSHTLEDLHDPLPAFNELTRVCKKVLIICPSRLMEQTMGADHPCYCGFPHHFWMVFQDADTLVFQQKTPVLNLAGCHIVCPIGMTLEREEGSMFSYGVNTKAEIRVSRGTTHDYKVYSEFIRPYISRKHLFVCDGRAHSLKYWV